MKKVRFECDTCGYKKIEQIPKELDACDADYVQTHMCDTGKVVVIDGVVEEV